MRRERTREQLSSPDWLLAGFDADEGVFQFARVSRQTYADSAFLDHRIQPRPAEVLSVTTADVDKVLSTLDSKPSAYIFHTAFCASTLLASCLDHPPVNLVLREPLVLSRLAQWSREIDPAKSSKLQNYQRRVFRLLDRSYAEEPVLVKPSNFANALIPDIMGAAGAEPGAGPRKCVLLSNGLRSLLISVLKKTEEAREKMTAFTQALLDDTDYATRVDLPPLESLPLLQQSVVFWHCQRYHFQNVMQALKPEQFFSLSTHSFVDQPGRVLSEINEFLSLRLSQEQLDETVQSGAFRQHSKKGSRYGPEQQRAEASETASRYASEIQSALLWASPLLKRLPPDPMSRDEDPLE